MLFRTKSGSSAISLTGFHVTMTPYAAIYFKPQMDVATRANRCGPSPRSPRAGTRLFPQRAVTRHFDARGDDGLASTSANEVTASHARCGARALASRENRTGRSLATPSGSSSSRWRCSPDAHPRLIWRPRPRTSRASRGRRAAGSRRRSRRARARARSSRRRRRRFRPWPTARGFLRLRRARSPRASGYPVSTRASFWRGPGATISSRSTARTARFRARSPSGARRCGG